MTPTLTFADLLAPRIALGAKVEANRSDPESTSGLDALMSAWVAIFQQQFAPAIPQSEVTPPPERVELSLTRKAESTPDASDLKTSDLKATATLSGPIDSLIGPSAELVALPVASSSGDQARGPRKSEPGSELTPKDPVTQPGETKAAAATTAPLDPLIALSAMPSVKHAELPPAASSDEVSDPPKAKHASQSTSRAAVAQPSIPDLLVPAETAQPSAPPIASITTPAISKNTTVVAPRPTSRSLSELLVPAGEPPALRTVIGLTRTIPQRFATKSNEVVAKFLSENSRPKPELQIDSNAEPLPEQDAVDSAPKQTERATEHEKPETPIEVAAKEPPAQSSSPVPAEPHSPAPVMAVSVPPDRVEASFIGKAPVAQPEAPVARPAPPPQQPLQLQPTPAAAKTISIRIPFTSSGKGEGAQHIDLIFQNRNNDLTLELHSPTTEIQQRIEESMPTLVGKLQTADWTAKPNESSIAEPILDSRKRAESSANISRNFESAPPLAQSESSGQPGSRFDQNLSNRKENPTHAQPGRNRKKDRAWQFEIDSETES